MFDETRVRCRLHGHGLLSESKEQLPAVPGSPTVEAERKLVQVEVQMRGSHGALMGTEQPPLEQGDHAVHPRQKFGREFVLSSQKRDPMAIAGAFNRS